MYNSIKNDIEINNVPMLVGKPGTGVITKLEEFIKNELNAHYFCFSCRMLISVDDLTMAINTICYHAKNHADETTVLVLDEINNVNDDIIKTVLSIATTRKINDTTLPDNLKIIMACNSYYYDEITNLINDNIVVYKIEE